LCFFCFYILLFLFPFLFASHHPEHRNPNRRKTLYAYIIIIIIIAVLIDINININMDSLPRAAKPTSDSQRPEAFVISAVHPAARLQQPPSSPAKSADADANNKSISPAAIAAVAAHGIHAACAPPEDEDALLSSPSECTPPPRSPRDSPQSPPAASQRPNQPHGRPVHASSAIDQPKNESGPPFASLPSKGPNESARHFNARIGLSLNFTDELSIRPPPTPPKASHPTPLVPPSLVAGYDTSSNSSDESDSEKSEGRASPGSGGAIRARKSLKKKARVRRVRFAENVEIRYIPSNRCNREREAQYMQQEFADFIDSMPISIDFANSDTIGGIDNDIFSFEEDLKAINSVLIDPEEEDLHLADAQDKADEVEQKELEDRVESLRNELKRPRDVDEEDGDGNVGSAKNDLDLEVLNILSATRKNKKRRVLTTTNNEANFNNINNLNTNCGTPSTLLNLNGSTKPDNDTTVAN